MGSIIFHICLCSSLICIRPNTHLYTCPVPTFAEPKR